TAFGGTVTAFDAYGNVATGYSDAVSLFRSDSGAALPAGLAFASGTAHLNVTFFLAGGQTLFVEDAAGAAVAGQATVAVSAASASHFVFDQQPSVAVAGSPASFLVRALDAYGNTASSYSGPIVVTSVGGTAALPGPTALTAGQGSFSVTFTAAVTQTIHVADQADASVSGDSAPVDVRPNAADDFVLVPSSGTTVAGSNSLQFLVIAKDPYGNIDAGYRGTVTIATNDPQVPAVSYTFTGADNGRHTFTVPFETAGSWVVEFRDDANGIDTFSDAVTVTPAAASRLIPTLTGPSTVTAGAGVGISVIA